MSKGDIIESLKAAIRRGESLNKVMISFYNSGYPKEDIEAAAREATSPQIPLTASTASTKELSPTPKTSFFGKFLTKTQHGQSQPIQYQKVQPSPVQSKPVYESVTQKEPLSKKPAVQELEYSSEKATYEEYPSEEGAVYQEFPSLQQPQNVQKVSQYGVKPSPVGAVVVFILVFFLLFLIGVLVSVFLFKDNLAAFFNSFIK